MQDTIVVVLGMGPTSLSLVRALGRKGLTIFGIGLNPYELALSSRYCQRLGAVDPRYHPEKLLELLIQFGKKQAVGKRIVLYPTGDECVVFIADNYEALSNYYSFNNLEPDIVDLFLNKARFYDACIEHNLPAPKTYIPIDKGEVAQFAEELSFPCILKPKYYHRWAMKKGLEKAIFCEHQNDLLRCFQSSTFDPADFIIQEIITGTEDNIYVVAAYMDRHYEPHGVFCGQKIRQYPVDFGTTTMIRTVKNPTLEQMSIVFLQKVKYEGLVDVEFKYDEKKNTFYVIEINPRLGRWYGIVEAAGHDTIYYSYLDLTNQAINEKVVVSRKITWVFWVRDILGIIKRRELTDN